MSDGHGRLPLAACGAEERRGQLCAEEDSVLGSDCARPLFPHICSRTEALLLSQPRSLPLPATSLHCSWTQVPRMNPGEMEDGAGFQFTCSCDS